MSDTQTPHHLPNSPGTHEPVDFSIPLDVDHHDMPERHFYGRTFLPPLPPPAVSLGIPGVPTAGVSNTPAREDHSHAWITDTWHHVGDPGEPAFQNAWVNYGGSETPAMFIRIGNLVFVRGLVKSGTPTSTIFVLPVGYRPSYNQAIPARFGAGTGGNGIGLVQYLPSGIVQTGYFVSSTGTGGAAFGGVAGNFSIDGFFWLGA